MDIQPKKSGFNWGLFLLVIGATLVALIGYNYFTQQKVYDGAGNQVGTTTTTGRMPKMGKSGKGRSRKAA